MTFVRTFSYGLDVPVSDDDPRPSYLQVADDLRTSIADGSLTPGQRLPSNKQFSEQYGVALATIQKALTTLLDAGLLVTHGRRGTFVADDPTEPPAESSEYSEISRQIGDLRDLLEQTAERLDERLTALEKAAGVTSAKPRSRPRRD